MLLRLRGMNTPRPRLRWLLLALLSLWTVALLALAVVLTTDSYGGMQGVPLLIAAGNVFAAIPFVTPVGPRLVLLGRAIAVVQGLAVAATGYLLTGAAASITSMGYNVDPGFSPFTVITALAGLALVILSLVAPPAPAPTP